MKVGDQALGGIANDRARLPSLLRVTNVLKVSGGVLMLGLFSSGTLNAQSVTVKYKYDVLGRVTFVEDPVNGNRDYDYDAAGNRMQVSVGNSSDEVTPTVYIPPPPTNLHVWQISQFGGYSATWVGNNESAYYEVRTQRPASFTIQAGQELKITDSARADWVRACNSAGCSAKAYF
jgi:hypothetical protein